MLGMIWLPEVPGLSLKVKWKLQSFETRWHTARKYLILGIFPLKKPTFLMFM